MSEKSENRTETPTAVADGPEGQASKAATNRTAESPFSDAVRSVLANRGRRYVLRCLRTSETPMALADLADELVRRETDASPTAVQDERERIYTLLYHYHLPKLAESCPVSFDADRKLVDLREDAAERPLDAVRTSAEDRPRDGR